MNGMEQEKEFRIDITNHVKKIDQIRVAFAHPLWIGILRAQGAQTKPIPNSDHILTDRRCAPNV